MELDELLSTIDAKVNYDKATKCIHPAKNSAQDCPDCLHNQYFSGRAVDYSCEQTRLVYVLRFLPVHMQENYSILQGVDATKVSRRDGSINVLALGGGPGSEIAALKKFILHNKYFGQQVSEIVVTRLDRVSEWKDQYMSVRKLYPTNGVQFNFKKIEGDVSTCNDYIGKYDLVFLSYILSELDDNQAIDLAARLKTTLNANAVLILNDRNEAAVVRRMKHFADQFDNISRYFSDTQQHLGLNYPQSILDRAKAKLKMKSARLGVVTK
jgi:hypothetical protein